MLEIIKQQYSSGKSLVLGKYSHLHLREHWPKYYYDMFPMVQDYYHELNPYFTFNIMNINVCNFTDTLFVRDGMLTFANFILRNYTEILKMKTHFIIHPDLAPIVPPNLCSKFSCWKIIQPKKIKLEKSKKIMISGIPTRHYIEGRNNLIQKLSCLKELKADQPIEIFLPMRQNIFEPNMRENTFIYDTLTTIQELTAAKKIKFITEKEFGERTSFNDTTLIDLTVDNFMVADNYIHYIVATKGGSVSALDTKAPADSYFKIDLSLSHEVHFMPLPKVNSIFVDLLLAFKSQPFPATDNLQIHSLLRQNNPIFFPQIP